jgi:hypothetical protein
VSSLENITPPGISADIDLIPGAVLSITTAPVWNFVPSSVSRQWTRDGAPIGGATGATYEVVAADGGKAIRVVVTARDEGGFVPAASNAIAILSTITFNGATLLFHGAPLVYTPP